MDKIDLLLLEAWDRIGAAVRADRLEALRRSRRTYGVLSRPMRAWCLSIRASDTRINDYTALIDPPGAVEARHPHRMTIDGKLIRRLTAPVRISRPGVTYHEAAALLGREYATVAQWARRGVLQVDYYRRFRRPNLGAPMVWASGPIDPNAPRGLAPHPAWGTLWQTLNERLPENYQLTAYRVLRFREDWRRPGRTFFHGWHFICPGRLARANNIDSDLASNLAGDTAGESTRLRPRAAQSEEGGLVHLPCGRASNYLFGPQSTWTLAQALGEDTGFDMPAAEGGGALGLAGQWFPGSAESDPTRKSGSGLRSFACWKCWNIAGQTWSDATGWNQFVGHVSGGLLYGREVPRPLDLVPIARRKAYRANPNMSRSRTKPPVEAPTNETSEAIEAARAVA